MYHSTGTVEEARLKRSKISQQARSVVLRQLAASIAVVYGQARLSNDNAFERRFSSTPYLCRISISTHLS